jgi:uncharacterized membrane protein YidH (DUF202 family)
VNSQYERTRLAWRRTVLALLATGGLGALHLALTRSAWEAVLVGLVAVAGSLLGLVRLASLRERRATATWQPAALTVTILLLSLTALAGT